VCFFIGKMAFSKILSCDSVIDGAFFSHPDFQVPEEKVCQHAREHVVMPACKFAHFVMVHAKFGFVLLEALLDRPAKSTEPDQRLKPCAGRCVADEIAVVSGGVKMLDLWRFKNA
jgi:hypothetical protein